jgi:hypothetical protein
MQRVGFGALKAADLTRVDVRQLSLVLSAVAHHHLESQSFQFHMESDEKVFKEMGELHVVHIHCALNMFLASRTLGFF